ncbi:MAG: secretin N-terminal domain-containing protein [Thermovirgaceae bacterium]
MGRPERRIGNKYVTRGGTVGRIAGLLVLVAAAFFIVTTILPAGKAFGASERPETGLTETGPTISGMTVNQAGGRLAVVELRGAALPAPEILATDSDRLVLLFADTVLPSGYWEKVYNIPLVKKVELSQEPQGVKMTVLGNMRLHLKNVLGEAPANRLQLHISVPSEEPQERVMEQVDTHGGSKHDPMRITEPVSLELRDSDLRDVFRMLGEMMNLNVLVDPSVPPEPVTITLKDVPLNEAFRYLMRMYDVTYAVMGKTVIFGKEANLARTLGTQKTKSFHVAYADPAQIPALLQEITGVTNYVVDERLRTVYVTASEAKLYEVEQTLDRIDHPGRQVLLQARIIEVTDDGQDEVEALVNAVYDEWWAAFGSSGGRIGYYDDNVNNEDTPYDPSVDPEDRSITLPGDLEFPDISSGALRVLDAGLRALETESLANVLASPSVVTVDGMPAEVKLTQNFIYQSGLDDNGNPQFETEEAGPTLSFTPTIGRSDIVTLDLDVATGQILEFRRSGQSEVPVTSTRDVTTTLRVRNGEPFVVGGLFSEQKTRSVARIPIISEIPLLGELFKIRNESTTNTEVVIVVVPYILDVPTEPVRASN